MSKQIIIVAVLLLMAVTAFSQDAGRFPVYVTHPTASPPPAGPFEAELLALLNNAGTDEKGNGDVSLTGGALYQTSPKWEGTHGVNCDGDNRRISIPSKNYGNEMTFSLGFFKYGVSGIIDLLSAYESLNGVKLSINMTNSSAVYLTLTTGNGTLTVNSNSSTFAMSASTWYHIVVTIDKLAGTCAFYVNGVARGVGTCRDDFNSNRDMVIGGDYDGSDDSYGYFDVIQFALFEWTLAEALTAYTTPGTEITR